MCMFINLVFLHLRLLKIALLCAILKVDTYCKVLKKFWLSLYEFVHVLNSLKFGMQLNPVSVTLPNRRIVGSVDSGPM